MHPHSRLQHWDLSCSGEIQSLLAMIETSGTNTWDQPMARFRCGCAAAGPRQHPLAGSLAGRWLAGDLHPIREPATTAAAGSPRPLPATTGRCNRCPCAAPRLDLHGPGPGGHRGGSAAAGTVRCPGLVARPGGQPPAAAHVACPVKALARRLQGRSIQSD